MRRRRWPSDTIIALAHTLQAAATIFQVRDSRPTLSTDDDKPIDWASGGGAYLLSSAEAVRVNFRGVHAYPRGLALRQLDKLGWTTTPCNASAWAMCASDQGAILPVMTPPRTLERSVDMPAGWHGMACEDNKGKVLVSQAVYDISACDILDHGLDVVYSARMTYHARTAMSVWRYWACVGLAIALVRALSYNVQAVARLTPKAAASYPSQRTPLVTALVLMGLTLLDLDKVFVTLADQMFFWCTVAYIGFYLALHGAARLTPVLDRWVTGQESPEPSDDTAANPAPHETPVFNVIVATLQLLAIRLYTAAETPYNLVLLSLLSCRAWTKLIQHTHVSAAHSLALTLDSLYIALCVELAFQGSDELIVAVFGVTYLCARLLV